MATYNGVCRHSIEAETQLPNGEKLIRGTFLMSDNYYAAGDTLNLSNYFANAKVTMIPSPSNGWTMEWNQVAYTGNLCSGKVIAKQTTGNVIATPIIFECAANTNLVTCNVAFLAIGKSK